MSSAEVRLPVTGFCEELILFTTVFVCFKLLFFSNFHPTLEVKNHLPQRQATSILYVEKSATTNNRNHGRER